MKADFWLDQIPLWGVFGLTAFAVFVAICIGTFLGLRRRRKPDYEGEASLGTIISATLGLVAFMLAFTFGITAERFQARRQLLLNEVNAIGTTYLRAGLLLEPHQSQVCKLLREYVDVRVNLARTSPHKQQSMLKDVIARSETLQDQMWSHAVLLARADRSSEIDALFINSLNEMIDLQTSRLTVLSYRIPPAIWYSLYFITILSMVTVGYQVGLSGKSVLKLGVVLALTFSAVVFLISDLDRAGEGSLRVSQQPMFELQKKMQLSEDETGQGEKLGAFDSNSAATLKK
ncbi:MAG: hypothetical protein A2178_01005 [Planctomycetes bacterium GWC2_49_10]|nr:MAG: hypothetical protein A2178_01005 [Planctomycetes bacterium GWC2_49_10]